MHIFSQAAIERPLRTIEAAKLLQARVWAISRATMQAREDELVIAVVEKEMVFGGVWTVAREDFARQAAIVEEEEGWSLTFEPRASISEIIERVATLAQQAKKRYERMAKYMEGQERR